MPVGSGGGGTGGGDVRAGGAYWEFFAKENISRTLDQVETKISGFAKKIDKIGGSAFAGGFLGGLLGGVTTISGALEDVGKQLADWVLKAKEFKEELAKSEKIAGELATLRSERLGRTDTRIDAIKDEEKRKTALKEEVRLADEELKGTESALKAARVAGTTLGGAKSDAEIAKELAKKIVPGGLGLGLVDALVDKTIGADVTTAGESDVRIKEAAHAAAKKRFVDMSRKLAEFDDESEKRTFAAQLAEARKDPFNRIGLNPILNALNPILRDPKKLSDAWEQSNRTEQNRMGGGMFSKLGGLLGAGLSTGLAGLVNQLDVVAREVRTGMGGGQAAQRLGYGTTVAEQSLLVQKRIADNTQRQALANAVQAGVEVAMTLR